MLAMVGAKNTCNIKAIFMSDISSLYLPEKTVHVWVLNDELVRLGCKAFAHLLSPIERQRANAYRHLWQRDRFIALRSTLRRLAGAYLDCRPEKLCFGVSPLGKPFLQEPCGAGLGFSVSSTTGIALLAFARNCYLGVDVERVVAGIDISAIGHQVFSSIEHKYLEQVQIDRIPSFYKLWTRKEALLKAIGTGFLNEPRRYTTEDDPQKPLGWCVFHDGMPLIGWTLVDISIGNGFCGALAASNNETQVDREIFLFSDN